MFIWVLVYLCTRVCVFVCRVYECLHVHVRAAHMRMRKMRARLLYIRCLSSFFPREFFVRIERASNESKTKDGSYRQSDIEYIEYLISDIGYRISELSLVENILVCTV